MSRPRFGWFLAGGLAVVLAIALLLSPRASSEPDGLERVAIEQGFDTAEAPHALADAPTAGYGVPGVDDDGLSTGLAGVIGVAVTFASTAGLVLLARRGRSAADA